MKTYLLRIKVHRPANILEPAIKSRQHLVFPTQDSNTELIIGTHTISLAAPRTFSEDTHQTQNALSYVLNS